jgi:hypothetical protein
MQEHSADAGDLLPGLVVLAEVWLKEVALGHFRDTGAEGGARQRVSLNAWYEAPAVKVFLKVGWRWGGELGACAAGAGRQGIVLLVGSSCCLTSVRAPQPARIQEPPAAARVRCPLR